MQDNCKKYIEFKLYNVYKLPIHFYRPLHGVGTITYFQKMNILYVS
jgi:hypothetical protein